MSRNGEPTVPSRADIEHWLSDLIAGAATREDAAHWAASWVERDELRWDDKSAWDAMKLLTASHLKTEDGRYFHSAEDFQEWLDGLRGTAP